MVSIPKGRFIKKLFFTDLGQTKHSCVVSLKVSLKHLVEYLENEEGRNRNHGGMTTALGNILKGIVTISRCWCEHRRQLAVLREP